MIPLTYVLAKCQTQRDGKMRGSFQGLGGRENEKILVKGYKLSIKRPKSSENLMYRELTAVNTALYGGLEIC